MDVRELFVQKVTDVATVEGKQYHIGGGLFDARLEWQEPVTDERVPGAREPAPMARGARTWQRADLQSVPTTSRAC